MTSDVIGKIGRGLGWIGVTLVSLVLAVVVGILPLTLLPGPVQTDFVRGQAAKVAGIGFAGAIVAWRLSPLMSDHQFSARAAGRFIWLTVTAFVMVFWPLGFAVWLNAHNAKVLRVHDMVVTAVTSTTLRPAVTPIEGYDLRDLSTGWTANLEVTDERRQFIIPGRCVRITVNAGGLGLDWISDARPIACPSNGH